MPPCKVCSTGTRAVADYHWCDSCDFISLDESKIVSAEREKKEYSFHQNSLENEGYVNMFRDFIDRAIRPCKPQITTALDFGSGPGPVLAELLRREGFETDIYDKYFSPDKVYFNKKYDLITATEVFEHLRDPLATMKLLKDHLNEGGVLAIMTLFHPNDEEEFLKWWYIRDATHIAFYMPRTLERMALECGMRVQYCDGKRFMSLSLSSPQ
ncbi:MAG: class I SAM-dependent methyltransferase [Candidatus Margulisbacteria bacterium]|nr:class I SAM-dependent methyltransferase [Candidatus Margulisiibacteriota bacterium]